MMREEHDVHGVIFFELQKHVGARLGAEAWTRIRRAAGVGTRVFTPVQPAPDAELFALVDATAAETGQTRRDVLEWFGRAVVPDLLDLYGPLLDPDWTLLDLLQHVEDVVHSAVRVRDPSATPPLLDARRLDEDTVEIAYGSARRMCALAMGLVAGLAEAKGEPVTVEEPSCMLRGDAACRIVVRRN